MPAKFASLTFALALLAMLCHADETAAPNLHLLIIDGQNNHNWCATTPVIKQALEKTGRFSVDVSSNLKKDDKPGNVKETVPFPPDLTKYDVVVSNYNGQSWPKEFQSFDERVKEGKLGLVVFHAANSGLTRGRRNTRRAAARCSPDVTQCPFTVPIQQTKHPSACQTGVSCANHRYYSNRSRRGQFNSRSVDKGIVCKPLARKRGPEYYLPEPNA